MLYRPNEPTIPDCRYNGAVACDPRTRNCEKCGWNPAVAKNRLEEIIKSKGVTLPEEE